MKTLLTFFIAAALLVACKNNKKAEGKETTETKVEKPMPKLEVAEDPKEMEPAPVEPQREMNPNDVQEPVYPDSLFFRMEKTMCFGQCPVYVFNIYKSGFATLDSRRNFEFIGMNKGRVSAEYMMRIVQSATNTGYFSYEHVYDAPVTDLPSITTILDCAEGKQWVYNRMHAPDNLHAFESEAEMIIREIPWQAYKPKELKESDKY